MKRRVAWLTWLAWLVATGALLALSWLALAPRLFFSSDTGLRYIQIQNLIDNHFTSLAIRHAPPGLDGNPLQAPYYWARSLVDGEIFLHISSLFPIAAAGAFAWLGTLGLALLPALGSIATGAGVAATARLCGLPRHHLLGLGSIVATPLLFYALVLWDHSWLCALATWGVYGVARGAAASSHVASHAASHVASRASLLGGAALGLATTQRPEFAALALAVGGALLLHTRSVRFRPALWTAAGGLLGALPLWLLQDAWVGHFLGMSIAPNLLGYGDTPEFGIEPVPWLVRLWRFFFYVEPQAALAPWAFAMAVGGSACIGLTSLRERMRAPGVLGVGFAAALVGYLMLAWLGWSGAVIGLAATFPFFPLVGLMSLRQRDRLAGDGDAAAAPMSIVRDAGLLFVALVVLAWPAYGGLQWGARYLLPAYPLLWLAAAEGFRARRSAAEPAEQRLLVAGWAALLAAAMILQGVGVERRFAANAELAPTRDALRQMSVQLVATDRYFLPSLLASMSRDMVFLDIVGDDELLTLIPQAVAAGVSRIAVVSRPGRIVQLPAMVAGTRVIVTPAGEGRTLIELIELGAGTSGK